MTSTSLSRPLEGVRILDLTAVWAGPYATRLLGDLGAEVIKVEGPKSPDLLRALALMPPDTERSYNKSAYFNHNNRNKLGCTLDLSSERGRELLLRLVEVSDVVIENFRAEVLEKLGLGYDELKQRKNDIILVSMPGHGKSGPERDYVGFGTNIEQVSGLAGLSGYRDGPPQKSGISYGDPVAGIAAAAAVVMALLARERTGKGRCIEVAQRENLSALIGEHLLEFSRTRTEPERIGNRDRNMAPHGCYPTIGEDEWITIACRNDADFTALCDVMDDAELRGDQRFATTEARRQNQDALDERISAWTRGRDRKELFGVLAGAGIPAAPVMSVEEIYHDPHLRERGFFERVTHAEAGEWDMDRPLYRFLNRDTRIERNAPMFGEHNGYVFGELLGLSADEMGELETAGIIAGAPDMSAHS